MKRENYVAPFVELMTIVENYPFAFDGSGEDSNVSTESMDDFIF